MKMLLLVALMMLGEGGHGLSAVAPMAQKRLSPFAQSALESVMKHPIVQKNEFCDWFAEGSATIEQAQDLVQQFSVFSNLFLLAQLRKCLNAPSLEDMRESKEILANEIGVVFKSPKTEDIFSPEGTIEGGKYSHRAAHFEWLLDVGKALDLSFQDMGKRHHGTEETLHFCDALYDIYGSENPNVSLGASFAIEHWAADSGFWDQLTQGFERFNKNNLYTPLGFWRYHRALEAQHAAHTMDELEEAIARGLITDEKAFKQGANDILDACAVFWDGLNKNRKAIISA